jgi:hypothetical protein
MEREGLGGIRIDGHGPIHFSFDRAELFTCITCIARVTNEENDKSQHTQHSARNPRLIGEKGGGLGGARSQFIMSIEYTTA